jgi:hypothetical protein
MASRPRTTTTATQSLHAPWRPCLLEEKKVGDDKDSNAMKPMRHTNNPYGEATMLKTTPGLKNKAVDDDNMNEVSGVTLAAARSLVAVDNANSLASPPAR